MFNDAEKVSLKEELMESILEFDKPKFNTSDNLFQETLCFGKTQQTSEADDISSRHRGDESSFNTYRMSGIVNRPNKLLID